MLTPAKIGGFRRTQFVDASCGESSTFLKASNGQFYTFRSNNSCQLAIQPVNGAANDDTLDLEERIARKTTFLEPTFVEASEENEITSVEIGKDHSRGINKRGRVYSWGSPTKGVLGREDVILHVDKSISFPTPKPISGIEKPIEAISCGKVNSGCIDCSGRFYTWGDAFHGLLGGGDDEEEDIHVPRKMRRTGSLMFKKVHKLTFGGQHVALLGQHQY